MDTADMTVTLSLDATNLADQMERIADVFREAAEKLRVPPLHQCECGAVGYHVPNEGCGS